MRICDIINKFDKQLTCIIKICFFVYVVFVIQITLFGRMPTVIRYELTPFWEYRNLFAGEVRWLIDILGNILLFLPFGFMLPTIFKHYRNLKSTFLTALIFSISIELLQLITARGLCEFDDVFNNTLGGVIGYGVYKAVDAVMKEHS